MKNKSVEKPNDFIKRNVLKEQNVSEVARHMEVTRSAISNFLNGKSGLTMRMAILFEKKYPELFDAVRLMNRQHKYEISKLRELRDA